MIIMTKILFIGSRLFDDVAYYCKENNIKTLITESNKEAPNLEDADEYFIVPRGMDEPMNIAIQENADAIIPLIGIDPPLLSVAEMKEKIEKEHNIPVLISNPETVGICADKIKTKDFFQKNNIPTPKSKILHTIEDIEGFQYPVVLKQGAGQGGKDIKVCKNKEDIKEYFETFNEALCEEFITGSEISIEVSSWNGLYYPIAPIYKGETSLEGIHPIARLRSGPTELKGLDNQRVMDLAYKIAKNLKAEGTIDIDLIYSPEDNEIYALEINTRVSGTRYLSCATTAINPLINLIRMVTGDFTQENMDKLRKTYHSLEIPVHNYDGPESKKPLKDFINSPYVVHGPRGYQRLTIRGDTIKDCYDTAKQLTGKDYKD